MFRTEVKVATTGLDLTLKDGVVTIGSCFAEVIGQKLKQNKVPVLANPFGTIFNPVSVAHLISAATGQLHNLEQNLVQRDGIWYSYDLHSSLSSPNKGKLLQQIEERINTVAEKLRNAKLLIVTLGTAIGYELIETGNVVANCHKLPARLFQKRLLSSDTIVESLSDAFEQIKNINPQLHIVLTVSPVRHVKETLPLNSVSKATLRVACHELAERDTNISYFPAFEIMMDDLRDYRFYGEDMLHPTPVAEDYIWNKFVAAYYTPSFLEFTQEWTKLRRAAAHKPFHPETPAHQAFLQNALAQLDKLSKKYSIDVTDEIERLQKQLIQ